MINYYYAITQENILGMEQNVTPVQNKMEQEYHCTIGGRSKQNHGSLGKTCAVQLAWEKKTDPLPPSYMHTASSVSRPHGQLDVFFLAEISNNFDISIH